MNTIYVSNPAQVLDFHDVKIIYILKSIKNVINSIALEIILFLFAKTYSCGAFTGLVINFSLEFTMPPY